MTIACFAFPILLVENYFILWCLPDLLSTKARFLTAIETLIGEQSTALLYQSSYNTYLLGRGCCCCCCTGDDGNAQSNWLQTKAPHSSHLTKTRNLVCGGTIKYWLTWKIIGVSIQWCHPQWRIYNSGLGVLYPECLRPWPKQKENPAKNESLIIRFNLVFLSIFSLCVSFFQMNWISQHIYRPVLSRQSTRSDKPYHTGRL